MNLRRAGIGVASAAGALLAALVVGGGFVYAGQLLPAPGRDRTLDITATLTDQGTVVLPADRRACHEQFGLLLEEGFLRYGGAVEGTCDGEGTVERQVVAVDRGDPATGVELKARFDEYIVEGDPATVGLQFTHHTVDTPRGDAPAWLVPGDADTWAVVVHGRSATREEALRVLPILAEAGMPSLTITHRNDFAGGPDAVDDNGRFGQTEWEDLDAAIRHALERGAERVVLVGFSQGGSLIGYYLREVGADALAGIVLDAPLLDLGDTLVQQARLRSIPDPLIGPILFGTRQVAQLQADFDVGDVDHVDTFVEVDVPILLFHGAEDDFVPVGPSDALAEARSDGLTYERVEAAGHVEAYNVDPDRYREAVLTFLADLA